MKNFLLTIALISLFFNLSIYAQTQNALQFDGSTGYFQSILLTGSSTSALSFEFWFTPVSSQAGSVFLGDIHSLASASRRRVMPYLNNGIISLYCNMNPGGDWDIVNYGNFEGLQLSFVIRSLLTNNESLSLEVL